MPPRGWRPPAGAILRPRRPLDTGPPRGTRSARGRPPAGREAHAEPVSVEPGPARARNANRAPPISMTSPSARSSGPVSGCSRTRVPFLRRPPPRARRSRPRSDAAAGPDEGLPQGGRRRRARGQAHGVPETSDGKTPAGASRERRPPSLVECPDGPRRLRSSCVLMYDQSHSTEQSQGTGELACASRVLGATARSLFGFRRVNP